MTTYIYSPRVCNMQRELIKEKTDELLRQITCPVEAREVLKLFVVEIVSEIIILPKHRSVYKILVKRLGKCERTIMYQARKGVNAIILDKQTREVFLHLGLDGEITAARFLRAAAFKVIEEVNVEKNRGRWAG